MSEKMLKEVTELFNKMDENGGDVVKLVEVSHLNLITICWQ